MTVAWSFMARNGSQKQGINVAEPKDAPARISDTLGFPPVPAPGRRLAIASQDPPDAVTAKPVAIS